MLMQEGPSLPSSILSRQTRTRTRPENPYPQIDANRRPQIDANRPQIDANRPQKAARKSTRTARRKPPAGRREPPAESRPQVDANRPQRDANPGGSGEHPLWQDPSPTGGSVGLLGLGGVLLRLVTRLRGGDRRQHWQCLALVPGRRCLAQFVKYLASHILC